MTARRFVIFDRDGTLIVKHNYLCDPALVALVPGAADALRALDGLGFGLVVVTNQSGIGRGYYGEKELCAVHDRLATLLADEGIAMPPVYWCPHRPEDGCRCRKPRPGLVQRAAADLGFDPRQSVLIGDNTCDMELGRAVGATTILVCTGHGAEVRRAGVVTPDYIATDVAEAAELILACPSRDLRRRNSPRPPGPHASCSVTPTTS